MSSPELEWRDDLIPVSTRFDDPYFSLDHGLHETNYVFLDGNGLPQGFKDGLSIAELGFGTGLNLLATVLAWRASGMSGRFTYTSFEAYPMTTQDMQHAHAQFAELNDIAIEFAPLWDTLNTTGRIETKDVVVNLITGDARDTLAAWEGQADVWYLDGFSPAKNPELWGADLMQQVFQHTAPQGRLATYTAAGFVRRNLLDAGFHVARRAGFGRKRHMTVAHKD